MSTAAVHSAPATRSFNLTAEERYKSRTFLPVITERSFAPVATAPTTADLEMSSLTMSSLWTVAPFVASTQTTATLAQSATPARMMARLVSATGELTAVVNPQRLVTALMALTARSPTTGPTAECLSPGEVVYSCCWGVRRTALICIKGSILELIKRLTPLP